LGTGTYFPFAVMVFLPISFFLFFLSDPLAKVLCRFFFLAFSSFFCFLHWSSPRCCFFLFFLSFGMFWSLYGFVDIVLLGPPSRLCVFSPRFFCIPPCPLLLSWVFLCRIADCPGFFFMFLVCGLPTLFSCGQCGFSRVDPALSVSLGRCFFDPFRHFSLGVPSLAPLLL